MGQAEKIDIVLTYVDGNDPAWREKRKKYKSMQGEDDSDSRYRDWKNLKYIFRGIEKYAPWVNKVFLVTDHQCPEWLNQKCEKLVVVNHEDYIPQEWLPTFNTNTIEVNFHRIKELSECFIIFNDDFFLMNHTKSTDFFKDGKPVDIFVEYPIGCGGNNVVFSHILANDFNMIGKYYSRREYRKVLKSKILSPVYGFYFFYNLILYMLPFPNFFGLLTPHFPQPYRKSEFDELWKKEGAALEETSCHRFRSMGDLSNYLFRLWNIMKGDFVPKNRLKMGKKISVQNSSKEACELITHSKYKMICLNDECEEEAFEKIRDEINACFEQKFSEKSSFEK